MKKRWFIVPLCALALVSVLVATAVCTDPDFTAPIPLGQEVDLVVGLNGTERANAVEKHNDKNPSVMVELRTISTNLENYFSEDVYGGCYFTGVIEKDPQLYFLLTDLSAAHKLENERVHFIEVKYTYKELSRYRDIVRTHYFDKGLREIGTDTKNNKITISVLDGTDISELSQLIPVDAYEITFISEEECPQLA